MQMQRNCLTTFDKQRRLLIKDATRNRILDVHRKLKGKFRYPPYKNANTTSYQSAETFRSYKVLVFDDNKKVGCLKRKSIQLIYSKATIIYIRTGTLSEGSE